MSSHSILTISRPWLPFNRALEAPDWHIPREGLGIQRATAFWSSSQGWASPSTGLLTFHSDTAAGSHLAGSPYFLLGPIKTIWFLPGAPPKVTLCSGILCLQHPRIAWQAGRLLCGHSEGPPGNWHIQGSFFISMFVLYLSNFTTPQLSLFPY